MSDRLQEIPGLIRTLVARADNYCRLMARRREELNRERANRPDPAMEPRPKVREQLEREHSERLAILRHCGAIPAGLTHYRGALLQVLGAAEALIKVRTKLESALADLEGEGPPREGGRAVDRYERRLDELRESLRCLYAGGSRIPGAAGHGPTVMLPSSLWDALAAVGLNPERTRFIDDVAGFEHVNDAGDVVGRSPGWFDYVAENVLELLTKAERQIPGLFEDDSEEDNAA